MKRSSQPHVYRLQATANRSIKECVCESCHATLGFSPKARVLVVLRRLHDERTEALKKRAS